MGSTRSGNIPRIAIEIRKNQYFDRALMLKSRLINRQGFITDLTTPDQPSPPGTCQNVLDRKKNLFKLKVCRGINHQIRSTPSTSRQ